MKHAILILAHKDFGQVRHLIEYFVRDCYVYMHIDKKAAITPEELHSIDSMPQVRAVYRKYKVHWGGFSILKTEMFLLRQVLKDGNCDYVHLISGQDYPIKPLDDFLKFFEEHKGKEFIRYANIPNAQWDHYTFSRFKYFYPYDYINKKTSQEALTLTRKIIRWEKRFGIKRSIPDQFDCLYGSTQWFSITIDATKTLLVFTQKYPAFYRRCRWTFASEEFYIATILCNLRPLSSISRTDLRFIRWKYENGNCPANLGTEHFYLLANTNPFFFARKFESPVGNYLINLIDQYLIDDATLQVSPYGGWNYNGFQKYSFNPQIAIAIARLYHYLQLDSILDFGCGAGFYVAALRRYGCLATGYDINPYTPHLSSLLLPPNDEPCGIADLMGTLDLEQPFDMVICLNVLSCIPPDRQNITLNNLVKCSGKYILISENLEKGGTRLLQQYEKTLSSHQYTKNELATSLLTKNCHCQSQFFLVMEYLY